MLSTLLISVKARCQASILLENNLLVVQVLGVLISHQKMHLIDIHFTEIVLKVRKCASKDGLKATL